MRYLILTTMAVVLSASGARAADVVSDWQAFVGQWRGVGQVRRGSNDGAWRVNGQWKWEFQQDDKSLRYNAPEGKYLQQARLSTGKPSAGKDAQLQLSVVDGEQTVMFHRSNMALPNQLVFVSEQPLESGLAKISLRLVAKGDRLVMALERRTTSGRFSRLGEVGFTRQGSRFGQGASYVECVVTGGKGTIAVTHKGETYYVCCTGCKDYFDENPEKVLAEYRQRCKEAAKDAVEKSSDAPEK